MSTPAKCHRVGQTSIYTMYDVRVPDRKKKKEEGAFMSAKEEKIL